MGGDKTEESTTLVSELNQVLQQEKESEIQKYEKIMTDFEILFENKNELIRKLATSAGKTHVVIEIADAMEHLVIYGKLQMQINEIATFLVNKLDGYVHPSTVWDNLPSRFKSHKKNPDHNQGLTQLGNPSENSSLNTDFEKENEEEIAVTTETIEFLKSYKNKLQHSHYESLLPDHIKKQCDEVRKIKRTILKIANAVCDDRQSVPIELQHLLVHAFVTQTNNDAAGIYVSYVKDFGANRSKEAREKLKKLASAGEQVEKSPDTLTSKQAVKILLGHVTKIAEIYEPKTRDEALLCGYHGTQCEHPECHSWRTYLDFDASELSCRCYACDLTTPRGVASKCKNCYLPFYDEVIRVMSEKGKKIADKTVLETACPHCKTEVFLPIKKLVPILVSNN